MSASKRCASNRKHWPHDFGHLLYVVCIAFIARAPKSHESIISELTVTRLNSPGHPTTHSQLLTTTDFSPHLTRFRIPSRAGSPDSGPPALAVPARRQPADGASVLMGLPYATCDAASPTLLDLDRSSDLIAGGTIRVSSTDVGLASAALSFKILRDAPERHPGTIPSAGSLQRDRNEIDRADNSLLIRCKQSLHQVRQCEPVRRYRALRVAAKRPCTI
jgi:hypothetical protein